MNYSWHTRLLLALASGATMALSFPNYNLWLLAWISVGLLILASYGARLAVAPLYGFLHSLVFYPMCLTWIEVVVHQYGNVPPPLAAGLVLLIAILFGMICAVFSWGVALGSRTGPAFACALAPFLWVALEFARAHVPIIGFPWNLAGYAASGNLALLQLTTITGIYGLSFLIAGFGALVAYAILVGSVRAWRALLVSLAALVLVAEGGGYFVPQAHSRYMAHLVQTNFPQSYTYPPDWMRQHAAELDLLERISIDAATKIPGVVIWPEVPAPFSLEDAVFAGRAREIAAGAGQDFLVGVEDWRQDASGKWEATNSAVLLAVSGARLFSYDKVHLVPFGEYVPLRKWLGFAGKLTADIGDFTPGTRYQVGRLPGGTFGAFICYEAIFPNEVRQFTAAGAQLLINMSNDGWFGRSAAPAQHVMMARVRAVENRRWLLRDTNNGFTIDVDPYGRTAAELQTDIRSQLDAPYDFRSDLTLYARFGDWFAWLSVVASLGGLGIAFAERLSQPSRA
jgi:apolipoprotein N-acyltransferase